MPTTAVTVSPPIQIVPSPSRSTCTRRARCNAVPCAGDVGRRRATGADQPLRQDGVEAAGDRVFADVERSRRTRAPRSRLRRPRRCGPTTPTSRSSTSPGASASTVVGDSSSSATSPVRCRPTGVANSARVDAERRDHAISSRRRPARNVAAAAPRRPAARPVGRMRIRPAAHSWTTRRRAAGGRRPASQTWQVPSVGWPANGSSPPA